MKIASDHSLIEQLKKEDNTAFKILYKSYFPMISLFVRQNMGNMEDAEDLFQEAVVTLFKKIQQSDFKLSCSLKTYLFAIAKNLWLKRLRDNKLVAVSDLETYQLSCEPNDLEFKTEKSREEKVQHWLTKITQHCQQILSALFFHSEPMETLMKKMGWKNKHTAANQQYKCIQQIKKLKEKEA